MSVTAVSSYLSDWFARHDPGPHPERPERAAAVRRAVDAAGAAAEVREAPAAPREALERVHDRRYLDALERFSHFGGGPIDPDTVAGPDTWDVAVRAAGAAIAAVDDVLAGAPAAFAGGRPPGHHAEPARAMGFCFLNSAAAAAAHARARGAERVAVLDWDVHHGNGTQAAFWRDPTVLYVSLHQSPLYPGTGAARERGEGPGEGATVNVPLPPGTGEAGYLEAFRQAALPALRRFAPDLLVVSAGFDAHRADPLADLRLDDGTFALLAQELAGVGQGRAYVLEGGYNLGALERSLERLLRTLAGT